MLPSDMNPRVKVFLETFDQSKYEVLISRYMDNTFFYKAYLYALEMPFEELPKYISHSSKNIRDIVKFRLSGTGNSCYMKESLISMLNNTPIK